MVVKMINLDMCCGCRRCVDVCTEDVIRFDEVTKKPYIKYPADCVACMWCETLCPVGAIVCNYTRPRKMPECV